MPLYRISLAYDGTNYQGWQVQPQADTIQGKLQDALGTMAGSSVQVVGAGRTDAGVHALGQVVHFTLESLIPPPGLPPDFHARYSARSKTYRYYLDPSPVASPFRSRFTLHHPHPLDREAMCQAAARFTGRRDFLAFSASSSEAKTTERDCTESHFFEDSGELIYQITANGFLHHMVRNIVGTLLEVGRGKIAPDEIDNLFEGRDRRRAGPTAPALGLHLIRVDYPS
jgi:tRNA pseudouridine38-40 synthase